MKPDFAAARAYALNRLESDVPAKFCYHDIVHTRDGVLPAAVRLAGMCGVDSADLLLLKTAALFHDLGFVQQAQGHEAISAEIAGSVLGEMGYSAEQIHTIQQTIRATALPQSPTTLLGKILCDADLDVLGRDDFLARNLLLYAELNLRGQAGDLRDWFINQYHFLTIHTYHTAAAHTLHDAGKQRNIERLMDLCGDGFESGAVAG